MESSVTLKPRFGRIVREVLRVLGGALLYAALCGFAVALGAGASWIGRSPIIVEALVSPIVDRVSEKPFDGASAVNILVLGCDQELYYRGIKVLNKYARSDMMMVVRFDMGTKRISGVSIPRDTVVAVPGYRSQKINAYHVIGGADLSKAAVESLLGLPIDRVVVLDFDAFQQMVDLVGGVDIYVPKDMHHIDRAAKLFIDLKAGRQVLSGYNAMCFVRYRTGDSDFKRTERQRDFMLAFKEAVKKHPMRLPEVANKAKEVLGDTISDREIIYLAKFALAIGNDNIKIGMIPVIDVPGSKSFELEVDRSKIDETLIEYHLIPDYNASTP